MKEINLPFTVKINRKAQDVVDNNDVVLGGYATLNEAMRAKIDAENSGAAVAAWILPAGKTQTYTVKAVIRMRAEADSDPVSDTFEYQISAGLIEAATIHASNRAAAAYAPMASYCISITVYRRNFANYIVDERTIELSK